MRTFLSTILLLVVVSNTAAAQSTSSDEAAIRDVVTAFSDAIIERDEAGMLDLFIAPTAVFASVRGDGSSGRVQVTDAAGFASTIANETDAMREDFFDIDIQIGETTATMMAPFDFVINDQILNHGYETWSLLRIGGEWKIASVVWSSNGPRTADN